MLVIFDCDGVLVDSEVLAARVFSEELCAIGMEFSPQDCSEQFQGRSLAYCFEWLEEKFQRPLPSNFKQCLDSATQRAFSTGIKAVEGIENVLTYLQEKSIPFCVASNGGHAKIEHSLKVTGLLSYFPNNRFSVEDVRQGKPAPDLFLHAADSMGVPARFCRVIEDSDAGVSAAIAAGMKAYAYCPESHGSRRPTSERFTSDVKVFEDMAHLPQVLEAE